MAVLFEIIRKNFKVLIRSRISALIVILGPLLIMFLAGIAFDNQSKYSLNIGTYSEKYSELSESFIQKLGEQEFKVEKIESEEICIEKIKQGILHTCIIFPPDLSIENNKMSEIVFHVDYSKINLIWMVLDTISSKLKERSSEISLDLASDMMQKLDFARSEIYKKKPTVINLKTENQEVKTDIDSFQASIKDFSSTSSSIKDYIATKVTGAQNTIEEIKAKIGDINASESQTSSITTRLNEINTYLYNIDSKMRDTNTTESDWTKLIKLSEQVNSQISSVGQTLSSSSDKITDVQSTLDNIYTELNNIQISNASQVISPITTTIKPVVPPKSYLNYLFPSLLVLIAMFISILLATTLVMMEKHSPAYFRNFITPTKITTFIFATYLTNLILVSLQLVILFLISIYFFKSQILPSLPVSIPCILLITSLFTLVGMLIGYLFTSEETATLASISVGTIFLFLSSMIIPIESMPNYIMAVAKFNPFVLGENMLRESIIFKSGFLDFKFELLWLLTYSIILFMAIIGFEKATRNHFFQKLKLRKNKKQEKKSFKLFSHNITFERVEDKKIEKPKIIIQNKQIKKEGFLKRLYRRRAERKRAEKLKVEKKK